MREPMLLPVSRGIFFRFRINLTRALEAIPDEMREDEKTKGLIAGLEATGRELESVFAKNGITRIVPQWDWPLDPNQHQAMVENSRR